MRRCRKEPPKLDLEEYEDGIDNLAVWYWLSLIISMLSGFILAFF